MNQDMNKVETYPAFVGVKVLGETDKSIKIPGTDYEFVRYGKRFFVKYKNPYTASLNWTNIVGVQSCSYDTVQLVKKELPKGSSERFCICRRRRTGSSRRLAK